jgi:hypothetical protein
MPDPDDPRAFGLLPQQGQDICMLGQDQSGKRDRKNGHDSKTQNAQHQQPGCPDAQPQSLEIVNHFQKTGSYCHLHARWLIVR